MRHYEIIFIFHPDQDSFLVEILKGLRNLIIKKLGVIDRLEDWGKRQLAYPIYGLHKARYILMNITCYKDVMFCLLNELKHNKILLRKFVLKKKNVTKIKSPMFSIKSNTI